MNYISIVSDVYVVRPVFDVCRKRFLTALIQYSSLQTRHANMKYLQINVVNFVFRSLVCEM